MDIKKIKEEINKICSHEKPIDSLELFYMYKQLYGKLPNWNNMTIYEKCIKGWLMPMLYVIEKSINGRYDYWMTFLATGNIKNIENKPIPQLYFTSPGSNGYKLAMNMLKCNIEYLARKGYSMVDALQIFVQWVLYGFGHCDFDLKSVSEDVLVYWYENFCLQILLKYPYDYFGELATEYYSNKKNGFFPTPCHIVDCMVQMVHSEGKSEKAKYDMVCDPCLGTGRMLLYSSNYSLRLYGQDINKFVIDISMINAYLYIPWIVRTTDKANQILAKLHEKYSNNQDNIFDLTDDEWQGYKLTSLSDFDRKFIDRNI